LNKNLFFLLFSFLLANSLFSQGNDNLQYVERLDLNCQKICSGYLRYNSASSEIPQDKYVKEGDWEYYVDGSLFLKEHYENGKLNGTVEVHYQNVIKKFTYIDGNLIHASDTDIGFINRQNVMRDRHIEIPMSVKSENKTASLFERETFGLEGYLRFLSHVGNHKEEYSEGENLIRIEAIELRFNLKSGVLDGAFVISQFSEKGVKTEMFLGDFKDGLSIGKWNYLYMNKTSMANFTIDFMNTKNGIKFNYKTDKDSVIYLLENCAVNLYSRDFLQNCSIQSIHVFRNGKLMTAEDSNSRKLNVYYENGIKELAIDLTNGNWILYDTTGKEIKNGCSYSNLSELMSYCNPSDTRFTSRGRGSH